MENNELIDTLNTNLPKWLKIPVDAGVSYGFAAKSYETPASTGNFYSPVIPACAEMTEI